MAASSPTLPLPLPGAVDLAPTLATQLAKAWAQRPQGYIPRTRHRDGDAPHFINRLFLETSPYLRQHAHNPVNWYPWGDEAFAAAKTLGRPLLLSVGYSTCHWCHVMEEESFEDEDVARLINERYIPIKVDREERPDVDAQYMAAVQAISGQGGWPMTVWLASDRRPYYGGTYFPPRTGDRGARVGFMTLLDELARLYHEDPDRVAEAARQLASEVASRLAGAQAGDLPRAATLDQAFKYYERAYDPEHGGIGYAPKFPATLPIRWLLRLSARTGEPAPRAMAEQTLVMMARGGIYDHVAGGFHRYSVDDEWLVPHFEKMLYDNALLVPAYLEGFQATGRADLAAVARDVLTYMDRDLSAPDGGFYAATDADSANPDRHGEREEGWFFTWTPTELQALLTQAESRAVIAYYGVTPAGNFEGRSILHEARPRAAVARELGMPEADLSAVLAAARPKLLAARDMRPKPLLDDKILAGWNGLAASAFARGAQVLGDATLANRARQCLDFLLGRMTRQGRLLRSYKDGEARIDGFLEDYAYVMQAALDVYETTFDLVYLDAAKALGRIAVARFGDAEQGGFFATSDDHEAMLVREKPGYDGATPSGNSVMALNLLRLAALTDDAPTRAQGEATLRAFATVLERSPAALAEMLIAGEFYLDAPRQIVLTGPAEDAQPFLAALHRRFLPHRVVVAADAATVAAARERTPLFAGRDPSRNVTAYVCREGACSLPVTTPDAFAALLEITP